MTARLGNNSLGRCKSTSGAHDYELNIVSSRLQYAYHRAIAEVIARFDGFVARYMGDGVLAYFGYPQAHEDDAERAVRAGLAAVEAIRELLISEPLQVRIGLATGLAVVGDLIGSGAAQEQAVVGETPNLAARLQALAEPGAIVIAESTRRLVGSLFNYQSLGEVEVKGLAAPLPAYRVLGESRVESRFEALRSGETPLVGRFEEIELLQRRWAQPKAGSGCVMLISAEPGIGKSRLTEAFRQSLAAEPLTRLRYFCSPHHRDSALFPIIGQLERAAGFEGGDSPDVKLGKLEALVATGTAAEGDLPLLAGLLSLPCEGRHADVELSPPRKKEKTFEPLLRHFSSLAQQRPVLMVFEDLQWADPTSRELLDRNMWLSLGAPGKLAHSRACEGEPSARLCSGEIALVRRLQVDAPFDREFEFLVRPLEYLDRLAVIHMHELRADDPFEFRDQPLLDPLVEEGEIFLSFVQ
jgi:hypothetical protein